MGTHSASSRSDVPASGEAEGRLRRRDFLILPLLSILTALTLAVGTEAAARHFFLEVDADSCRINDANIGFSYRPGCISRLKTLARPWVTNQFNECGFRSKESCGPKPAGTIRIALLGSSTSEGFFVPYDQTFATHIASDLTRKFGRPVDVQNLGVQCYPICEFRRLHQALALKPDLLLLAVSPFDIEHLDSSELPNRYKPMQVSHASSSTKKAVSPIERLVTLGKESTTRLVFEHLLFQDTPIYIRIYLHHGDPADYLRPSFSPAWEGRLNAFELLLSEMSEESRAANVPFVLIEIPTMVQASLASAQNVPAGIDPYAINRRLSEISSRHGVEFISALDGLQGVSEPSRFFTVEDGHLNAAGHAMISDAVVEQLTKQQLPILSGRIEPRPRSTGGSF
jgi:hypothetical protein